MKAAPALAALILLGACGHKTAGDQVADNLQKAADQSDPAAAQVLDNAADAARNQGESADANATAQAALAAAGNATDTAEQPASTRQATPHRAGERVPSPKR